MWDLVDDLDWEDHPTIVIVWKEIMVQIMCTINIENMEQQPVPLRIDNMMMDRHVVSQKVVLAVVTEELRHHRRRRLITTMMITINIKMTTMATIPIPTIKEVVVVVVGPLVVVVVFIPWMEVYNPCCSWVV